MSDAEAARVGARKVSKEYIFEHCDVITLHSALNEENRGMITASLLSAMKEGALFVNTARAGLVDDDALLKELQNGRFQAVLDVFPAEPLAEDRPFRSLNNALLLPHIAGPLPSICGRRSCWSCWRYRHSFPIASRDIRKIDSRWCRSTSCRLSSTKTRCYAILRCFRSCVSRQGVKLPSNS